MIKFFVSAGVVLLLTGCEATIVKAPSTDSQYAPVNESELGGVVKYLNQGAKTVIRKRRESAYRKMWETCNEQYEIVKEGPKSDGGTIFGSTGANSFSLYYGKTEYWYIQFRCL